MSLPKVLFVCTGNYYRSRFAEELFNHLANETGLDWTANSAGLKVDESRLINIGTFSPHTYEALAKREITPRADKREPRQIEARDFDTYDLIIALCDREHRPMVDEIHPENRDAFTFWTVEDIQYEDPTSATEQIEKQVRNLVAELSKT